jgi:predicted RNA-binding protein (TIGR00451 family)
MLLDYDNSVLESIKNVYGDSYHSFLEAITRPSRRLYVRVNRLRTSVGEVIDTLRSRGIAAFQDEELEEAIYFYVEGPYNIELYNYDNVIVVDKYAAESIYLGSNLYIPGIVKCPNSVRKESMVVIVTQKGLPIAEGISMINCNEIKYLKRGIAVEVTKSVYKAPKIVELPEYKAGLIYPQSLAAMYVIKALDPKPNDIVIDTCAAPGGKTGHIVEYTMGKAFIIAFDHSKKRLEEMKRELERLKHTPFIEMWRADSRFLHIDFSWIKADKIIVDPPCTSLGVRPKLYDTKRYKDVISASRYQLQFLKSASKILKIGGTIVYSTCTITIEENENVIESIIENDKCLKVVDTGIARGSKGIATSYSHSYTRFHPHIHDTTGYFIAKLIKIC